MEDISQVFVSGDGDSIGNRVGLASLHDDPVELRRISQSIERGNEIFRSWALSNGGNIISMGGDEFRLQIGADHLEDLQKLCHQYQTAVGATLSVGVGLKMSEADKALLAAKLRGKNQVVFYEDSIDQELESVRQQTEEQKISDAYLGKAEHPIEGELRSHLKEKEDKRQQALKDQEAQAGLEDTKGKLLQILQQLRQYVPQLESIKQENPDLYSTVNNIVQMMVVMIRQYASQNLEKSEPSLKAKKLHLVTIPGFILPTGPGSHGKAGGGKIKVITKDGKTRWRSARSGMVMNPDDGQPISSRNNT